MVWGAGLTEGEKDEGEKAKEAIREEQGGDGENVSDDEMGNHKAAGQFFGHLKKNEVGPMVSMSCSLQCVQLRWCLSYGFGQRHASGKGMQFQLGYVAGHTELTNPAELMCIPCA